jgi:hypothetical protein
MPVYPGAQLIDSTEGDAFLREILVSAFPGKMLTTGIVIGNYPKNGSCNGSRSSRAPFSRYSAVRFPHSSLAVSVTKARGQG